MKFFIYSVYDPEVESFDTRLNLGPLTPEDMAEQYKRAHIKMNENDKKFMAGKKAVCLGVFDDETGKIEQAEAIPIYDFGKIEKEPSQVVKGEEEGKESV